MPRYYRHLDGCPKNTPIKCLVEFQDDMLTVVAFWFECPLHKSARGVRTDQQQFEEIQKTMHAREGVRKRMKELLALDKEHPGVDWETLDDGNIVIKSGATGQQRTTLRNAAASILATKPMGFGKTLSVE